MRPGKIYIGTSGWSYSNWRGGFYPNEMASSEFLAFYSATYNASEINSTFYHIPRLKTVEKWIEGVPAGFKFCLKLSIYITHKKRLHEPEEPLAVFFKAIDPVKKMAGPVLIQLPPSLKFDLAIAKHFFMQLKKLYQHYDFAIEPRHQSWFNEESIELLKHFQTSLVISESGNRYPYAEIITSKNIYVRFHGPDKLYDSPYADKVLQQFANKFRKWSQEGHSIWVFFNNTMHLDGLNNANTLKAMLEAH